MQIKARYHDINPKIDIMASEFLCDVSTRIYVVKDKKFPVSAPSVKIPPLFCLM